MVTMPRAALYVDGFNLYHPIDNMKANHLKWLDLTALGRLMCKDRGHDLVSVTYCTAFQRHNQSKMDRHKAYIAALEATGPVKTVYGHYMEHSTPPCGTCGAPGIKETEKQTDINVALSVFSDAMQDKFDWAYLLSADSDQAATAKFLRDFFPGKKLVTVAPPDQDVSEKIFNLADGKRQLNRADIEKCRLPSIIMHTDGRHPLRCPRDYDLPK